MTTFNKKAQDHLISSPEYKAEMLKRERVAKRQRLDKLSATMMMRQGIETKFLEPTNHKGSRIKATAAAGSITITYDCAFNTEQNHIMAAEALAKKYEWTYNKLAGAGNSKGAGYMFILLD